MYWDKSDSRGIISNEGLDVLRQSCIPAGFVAFSELLCASSVHPVIADQDNVDTAPTEEITEAYAAELVAYSCATLDGIAVAKTLRAYDPKACPPGGISRASQSPYVSALN